MRDQEELIVERRRWAIDDEVTQLRATRSDRIYELPRGPFPRELACQGKWTLGGGPDCQIQLREPLGFDPAQQAILLRLENSWLLLALGNGSSIMKVDGEPEIGVHVIPGTHIELGSVSFVAESPGLLAFGTFLRRLLGSSEAAGSALQLLRQGQLKGAPVVLRGKEDLVAVAMEMHRRLHGEARPFIVYRELHQMFDARDRLRLPRFCDGAAALAAAQGGTLCLLTSSPPPDYEAMCGKFMELDGLPPRVVICDDAGRVPVGEEDTIYVPPMRECSEVAPLVYELGCEAMKEAGLDGGFGLDDVMWTLGRQSASFMQIQTSVRILAALRQSGSLFEAATQLRMSPAALRTWIGERPPLWLRTDAAWDAN